MEDKVLNEKKKKAIAGLLATLTSFSLTLGSVFESAEELKQNYPQTPKAVIESIDDYSEDNLQNNEMHDSFKERLKKLIYKIPVKVRTVLLVPLWAVGHLLILGIEALFEAIFLPLLSQIGSFLIQTLIMLLVAGICIKILFPDMPWSKIFSKKTILAVLIGSLIIKICDLIMPHFFEKYKTYKFIIKTLLSFIVTAIILKPFIVKKLKNRISYDIVYDDKLLKAD